MEAINKIESIVCPLNRDNIDTDAIMPKQFLKSTTKTGYGDYLFDEWRYSDSAEWGDDCSTRNTIKTFPLNQDKFKRSKILLAGYNFGCGSSREHAVWGLKDFGFKVVIAKGFASIFYNNAIRNGLLAITLTYNEVDNLFSITKTKDLLVSISLPDQCVSFHEEKLSFNISENDKDRLLNGKDDIDITSNYFNKIKEYEKARALKEPWIFADNK